MYHATDTVLEPLDRLQTSFLQRLRVSEVEALIEFNLAPLCARRDMGVLGVLHRAALKQGPEHLHGFFQLQENTAREGSLTRLAERRHNKQLVEHRRGRFLEILRRSALGLVAVYNLLWPEVVAESTVQGFQRKLQEHLKERAAWGCENWQATYSPRTPLWRHPLR